MSNLLALVLLILHYYSIATFLYKNIMILYQTNISYSIPLPNINWKLVCIIRNKYLKEIDVLKYKIII